MDHVDGIPFQKGKIGFVEFVHVGDDPLRADEALAEEVAERGAVTAIAHIASHGAHEVVEWAGGAVEHGGFLDGLGEVGGDEHAILPGDGAGKLVKLGGGGVGGVRAEAEAAEPFGMFAEEDAGAFHEVFGGDALADVDHLVEPPGADGWPREAVHELGEGFDVEDGGRAPFAKLCKAVPNGFEVVFVIKGALESVEPLDPCGKTAWRLNGAPEHRVVEMAVGVDESGHQDLLAQVDDSAGVECAHFGKRPDGLNAAAFYYHGAVVNGRTAGHRNQGACAEDHGVVGEGQGGRP